VQPLLNIETVATGGGTTVVPFYGLVFYGQAPLVTSEFPWARLQGLSGEPGTFALAIIPAYFYFLMVEKSFFKLSVVVLGLVLTVSLGIVLFLIMVAVCVILFRAHSWKKMLVHIGSVVVIMLISISPTDEQTYEQAAHWQGWSSWVEYLEAKSEDKAEAWGSTSVLKSKVWGDESSFGQRIGPVKDALRYLGDHPWGTGMALGMITLNEAVAMGYALAALESGIIGGTAYLLAFLLLTFLAIRSIKRSKHLLEYGDLKQALAFIVLADVDLCYVYLDSNEKS